MIRDCSSSSLPGLVVTLASTSGRCNVGNTSSYSNTEVRQYCAWMVLGWETGRELQLLLLKPKAGLRCGTMWARQMCAKLFQGVLALESLDSAPDRLLRVVGSDPLFPQTLLFQAIPSQKPKLCSHMLDLKDQTSNLFRSLGCQTWWHIQVGASTTNSLLFSTPNADHLTTSQSCENSSVLH